MISNRSLLAGVLLIGFLWARPVAAGERLVVHEWGTFTSLQNEQGRALGHINTDDEPVPLFVHQLGNAFLFRPTEPPPRLSQGAPAAHPYVTMRLETPILYFHLPPGAAGARTIDVEVEFHGGWLTQFYPRAEAEVMGTQAINFTFGELSDKTIGRLSWKAVKVGDGNVGPPTREHVWTAPRAVRADTVTCKGESEKFLFYRGVGQVNAPLRVVSVGQHLETLHIKTQKDSSSLQAGKNGAIQGLWLVDVHPDGATAFRRLPDLSITDKPDVTLATTSARFGANEYHKENVQRLRAQMKSALEVHGLFTDEAEALLSTWQLSYFQSPGLRLFFLVPRTWTVNRLPLKLSTQADVVRVMVGRIELVTPRQRELIRRIARGPAPHLQEVSAALESLRLDPRRVEKYQALASGRGNPADLGVPVPEGYQAFLDLGRFRTALLMESARRNEGLEAFLWQVEKAALRQGR